MRLDKFLKVSRLVKRRTLAKELCDGGRVAVNGRVAKAGTDVEVGHTLQIRYGARKTTVRVEKIAENVRKELAVELYTVLDEVRLSEAPLDGEGEDDLED